MSDQDAIASLPYALGVPCARARLRVLPEDFQVDEALGFAPDDEGQHVLLRIRKRGMNTAWLARLLAQAAAVPSQAVSYAGRKDRHAVTTQWFSVDLAGASEPDWHASIQMLSEGAAEVLAVHRHRRKLRPGTLTGNHFVLRLRDVQGDRAMLTERLAQIQQHGVPNYFGEQRFGHQDNNLREAAELFAGKRIRDRARRALLWSAARSYLFNQVLAARIAEGSWNRAEPGDVLQWDGSGSWFVLRTPDLANLGAQLAAQELHPTGPLWGQGPLPSQGRIAQLEQDVLQRHPVFCQGLQAARLDQDRRSLRLIPRQLEWRWLEHDLELGFFLTAGGYATTVLRELLLIENAQAVEERAAPNGGDHAEWPP
jgi:tRNA pseudouridine13 synthase